jgi:hypothetical protein
MHRADVVVIGPIEPLLPRALRLPLPAAMGDTCERVLHAWSIIYCASVQDSTCWPRVVTRSKHHVPGVHKRGDSDDAGDSGAARCAEDSLKSRSDLQERSAICGYLHRRRYTASRPSAAPRIVGNNGSPGSPLHSLGQTRSTATVWAVSGVHRSLRPFPWQRRWAPRDRRTSWHSSPVNSETRRPVCKTTRNWVRSRRSIHAVRSGAAKRARSRIP